MTDRVSINVGLITAHAHCEVQPPSTTLALPVICRNKGKGEGIKKGKEKKWRGTKWEENNLLASVRTQKRNLTRGTERGGEIEFGEGRGRGSTGRN